ncbi:MAG TPA: hypothetical protein EYP10_13570, partial [Armatimonadetes bacterium]|nr:hypothetical protein [Armatimonadota bacterium]
MSLHKGINRWYNKLMKVMSMNGMMQKFKDCINQARKVRCDITNGAGGGSTSHFIQAICPCMLRWHIFTSSIFLILASVSHAATWRIYEHYGECVWGHWGRVYEQHFIPDATGTLRSVTFTGTTKRGKYRFMLSVIDAMEGKLLITVGGEGKDDVPVKVNWFPQGKITLERGREYVLRLDCKGGWAIYVAVGRRLPGKLMLDGRELICRAMVGEIELECEPANLEVVSIESDVDEILLPKRDIVVTMKLRNFGGRVAQIRKASLRFWMRDGNAWKDVTKHFFVEADESNPVFVSGGEEVRLRYLVEAFHDTPIGEVQVGGWVEWFDAGENMLSNGSFEVDE